MIEQGLPPYLLREIDLVVFPRHVDGERYVGQVVELLGESRFRELDRDERCGVVRKQGTAVYWNAVAWRRPDGAFAFAAEQPASDEVSDGHSASNTGDEGQLYTFERVAELTDRTVEAVEEEFRRKHRYVEYFVRAGVDDFEALYDLLADLETDEAATVERLVRQSEADQRSVGDD